MLFHGLLNHILYDIPVVSLNFIATSIEILPHHPCVVFRKFRRRGRGQIRFVARLLPRHDGLPQRRRISEYEQD